MGRSKRKKASGNDIVALPVTANRQQQPPFKASAVSNTTIATPGRGGRGPELSSPRPQPSLEKLAHRGTGSSSSGGHQLPTITRGPEALRQTQNHGSPLQRTPGNQAAVSKIEYLGKIATWAAAKVPSLGAFYGERLASTCESAGIPSPVLSSQCERCESILLPGVNCSVRVTSKKKTKHKRRRKGEAGEARETVNLVVYQCHYCKYRNQKPGTPKQHVKTKLAQAAARAQMKDLASNSSEPSANIEITTPAQGVMKCSAGADLSTTPITPAESLPVVSLRASALHVDHSSNKKRKRKGWTGLKAMASSLQNRELPTPERLGFGEDFSSPLNPRKKGSI